MQPPGALSGHLTKDQLQKISPHAKIISLNTWLALLLFRFSKFIVFSVSVRPSVSFSSEHGVDLASNCSGAFLPVPPPYPEQCMSIWMGAGVGGGVPRRCRQLLRCQSHPWRPAGTSTTFRRRPAPPKPPEASVWLSASCARCGTIAVA